MTNFFAENLKYLRNEKKLSQNKLAELANVNQATINRWESKEMSPNIDNINDVAKVLNISVADLLDKDLSHSENKVLTQQEILFNKTKDFLTESDWNIINTIVEQRKKEIDKELGESEQ